MVARKLSSYDVATSPESFSKRPSVYIDPESDIFEGLQYLHNIKRQNCINCLHLRKKSSAALEGISMLRFFFGTERFSLSWNVKTFWVNVVIGDSSRRGGKNFIDIFFVCVRVDSDLISSKHKAKPNDLKRLKSSIGWGGSWKWCHEYLEDSLWSFNSSSSFAVLLLLLIIYSPHW